MKTYKLNGSIELRLNNIDGIEISADDEASAIKKAIESILANDNLEDVIAKDYLKVRESTKTFKIHVYQKFDNVVEISQGDYEDITTEEEASSYVEEHISEFIDDFEYNSSTEDEDEFGVECNSWETYEE